MTSLTSTADRMFPRAFWEAMVVNYVWINISEVFRYFAFVMPMMRKALPGLPNVAPMNVPIFLLWGVWDTILIVTVTVTAWFAMDRFGNSIRVAFRTATGLWIAVFGILWLGLLNMNLATLSVAGVALPLAWLELFVAVLVVRWTIRRRV